MIQAKDLSPDCRRITITSPRVKISSSSIPQEACFNTHTQRYRVTRIVVEVLIAITNSDFTVGVYEQADATQNNGTATCTVTVPAGSGVGIYSFGPGELTPNHTLPFTLEANKNYYVWGLATPGGTGTGVISVDLEPVDDNPQ